MEPEARLKKAKRRRGRKDRGDIVSEASGCERESGAEQRRGWRSPHGIAHEACSLSSQWEGGKRSGSASRVARGAS